MTNAMDLTDDDSDGLNNRWETFLGTDPGDSDTDGDGVSDSMENRAGTSATDPSSFFVMSRVTQDGADVTITWPSAVGKDYQIECSQDLLSGSENFITVGNIYTATSSLTEVTIPGLIQPGQNQCSFRVLLVEDVIQ
jgi:hypothetical protein